jgi:hypothetical protein
MAAELDHIALANKNHRALERLMENQSDFPEWIATVAFYKALQLVEAAFSHHATSRNCTNHPARLAALKLDPFKPLFKHYRALYSASTVARYLHDNTSDRSYSKFADFLPAENVVPKLVYGRLRPIEQNIIQFLSVEATTELKRLPST